MLALFGSIAALASVQDKIDMLGRRHVAVARCGVYLDETDEPGGTTLARRVILKFDSIVSCSISFTPPYYSVVIVTRNTNKPTTASEEVVPEHNSHNVTGLLNGQVFVDLVSTMMDRSKQASSNTGPSPTDSVRDMTSVEMV
jgi:hypothetical protein